jgi:hypothetical protein
MPKRHAIGCTEFRGRWIVRPVHCPNTEQTFLSGGSIVHRFPLFHSSYETREIVMNASRVRT